MTHKTISLPVTLFGAAQHPPVVIAVERGEPCPHCHDRMLHPNLKCADVRHGGPPAAFTALVDQPCETCAGSGLLKAGSVHPKCWGGQPAPCATICPDCFDGIAPVVLRTKCETCGGEGCMHLCPDCETGYRSLSVKVACMRIIEIVSGYPTNKPEKFLYVSKAGSLRFVDSIAQTDTYIGDPATVAALGDPADWRTVPHRALVVTEVKS